MGASRNLIFSILALGIAFQFASAATDIDYNKVDIDALQNEYRRQLDLQSAKTAVHKPITKKKPSNQGIHSVRSASGIDYNTIDIGALQNQYRSQLDLQSANPLVHKPIVKKKPSNQQQRSNQRQLQQHLQSQQHGQSQKILQQKDIAKVARSPVSKAPILGNDILFDAASRGDVPMIRSLLNQGMNTNAGNAERETALHMAAAKGHFSAVIYLINHGADMCSRTVTNWLPIHHATRFGHTQIANYLKQRGSSPYARTSDGLSAIDMAKENRDQRMLAILRYR